MTSEFGIPQDATCQCPPPLPSAVLSFGSNDVNDHDDDAAVAAEPTNTTTSESRNNDGLTTIAIGKASQVVANRNALLVGRQASTCDIRITHKSLSRQHALLYYRATPLDVTTTDEEGLSHRPPSWHLYIYDLDTKSGTFVNQQRIGPKTPVRIRNGDTIQFGKAPQVFTVRWKVDDDEEGSNDNGGLGRRVGETSFTGSSREGKDVTSETTSDETTRTGTFENTVGTNASIRIMTPPEQQEEGGAIKLTGRAQRQAEIAAMMASLDETPTYTRHVPTIEEQQSANRNTAIPLQPTHPPNDVASTRNSRVIQKYKLPLTESTVRASIVGDETESSQHHHVSSIVMDPTGARFAVGSMDSSLKLYDFGGYNADDPVPFQNVIVQDGYPVRSMSYSSTGDRLLVGTGSSQPYLLDRDGQELLTFVRGDVYVTDPSKTAGHTAAVTSVGWHPLDRSLVFTTSRDGSLRTWNVDKGKLSFGMLTCSDVVVIKSLKTGRKTIPTCSAVASTAVAMGTVCGSVQIYQYPFVSKLRPQQSVHIVVGRGTSNKNNDDNPVVSVVYSPDASKLASRTMTAVHVWNTAGRLSTSSTPWMTCSDDDDDGTGKDDSRTVSSQFVDVDNCTPTMAFSPDGKVLCVATTTTAGGDGKGRTVFSNTLRIYLVPKEAGTAGSLTRPVYKLPIHPDGNAAAAIVAEDRIAGLAWHVRLNQLLVATTGGFRILYSSDWSKKGVLLSLSRRGSKRRSNNVEEDLQDLYASRAPPPGASAVRDENIIVPNALPLFGGDDRRRGKKKSKLDDEVDDDTARHIPQRPPARGVYDTQNTMFTQMIMDNKGSTQKQIAGRDPREALAMYSEGKSYIAQAYEGNVERILADKTVEQEEDEMKEQQGR